MKKSRAERLTDTIYGPDSQFFWYGTVLHGKQFVLYDRSVDCSSTKELLENCKDNYSGVEGYIENGKKR